MWGFVPLKVVAVGGEAELLFVARKPGSPGQILYPPLIVYHYSQLSAPLFSGWWLPDHKILFYFYVSGLYELIKLVKVENPTVLIALDNLKTFIKNENKIRKNF